MESIQFTSNPSIGENVTVVTRGVMTDAKAAKTDNVSKRPLLLAKWRNGRPAATNTVKTVETASEDSSTLLEKIGITSVARSAYRKQDNNSVGAKKLRVNKIVVSKTKAIYQPVEDEIEVQKEESQELVDQINALTEDTQEERGRHEKTAKIPVVDIKEALQNDTPVTTRMTRSVQEPVTEKAVPEAKAGDIDLYTNLYNNIIQRDENEPAQEMVAPVSVDRSFYSSVTSNNDVSRQLQGAKEELSMAEAEGRKLLDEYNRAIKEVQEIEADIQRREEQKKQETMRELAETRKSIKAVNDRNLEVTQSLGDIRKQLAVLKARRDAIDADAYELGGAA